jgi:hypothetical protein
VLHHHQASFACCTTITHHSCHQSGQSSRAATDADDLPIQVGVLSKNAVVMKLLLSVSFCFQDELSVTASQVELPQRAQHFSVLLVDTEVLV